ncbi:MAG: alpha/beta hydrolase [Pontibacterium sp.]
MYYTEEIRFEVNGHMIAATSSGNPEAPAVIALHGWLDNAATFNQMIPFLKGMRFIALDLMGHGYSDHRPPSMPYYIWDNVADVIGIADELGLEQLNLVGHSMGASVASLLAGAFPDRVKRLCLIEGIAPLVYAPQDLPALMAQALDKRRKMRGRRLKPYASMDDAIEARMRGRFPVSAEAAAWLVNRGAIHGEDGVYWRNDASLVLPSILRMSEEQVQAFLNNITADVDLILGKQGLEMDALEANVGRISQLKMHRFQGNHHLHLEPEAAEQIATLVNAWFNNK